MNLNEAKERKMPSLPLTPLSPVHIYKLINHVNASHLYTRSHTHTPYDTRDNIHFSFFLQQQNDDTQFALTNYHFVAIEFISPFHYHFFSLFVMFCVYLYLLLFFFYSVFFFSVIVFVHFAHTYIVCCLFARGFCCCCCC